ncbi:hypothetical protein SOJ80_001816 [Cronobacter universalis]|nr:hypothetical protein [Cronobacter universalis]
MKFQEFLKELGFDVKKYQALDELDDFNLVQQLKVRDELTKIVKGFMNEDEICFRAYFIKDVFIEKLGRGGLTDEEIQEYVNERFLECLSHLKEHYTLCFSNPVITESVLFKIDLYFQEHQDIYEGHVPHMLSYSEVVHPLSRWSLENFLFKKPSLGAGTNRLIMLTPEEIDELDNKDPIGDELTVLSNESVSAIAPELMSKPHSAEDFSYSMYMAIDIKKTDEEILRDLEKLLPVWRKELNIDPPEKKRSWEYMRSKILSYRIIALMDLQEISRIYTTITKTRVPKRLISLALYPEGERDGFGLDQTVIPFLEKIRGKSYKLLHDYKINKK